VGDSDIYIDALPLPDNLLSSSFNLYSSPSESPLSDTTFCQNITQLQDAIVEETKELDNILRTLRQYYSTIKTKRQLGLEVLAGFGSSSTLQQSYRSLTPPRRAKRAILDKSITQPEQNSSDEPTDPILLNCFSNTHSSSESNYIPIVRSVDKASSSLPNNVTMSEDFIRASVGFLTP